AGRARGGASRPARGGAGGRPLRSGGARAPTERRPRDRASECNAPVRRTVRSHAGGGRRSRRRPGDALGRGPAREVPRRALSQSLALIASVLPPAVPTAQRSVVANAETDDSSPRPPGPFGLDTTVQAVPSQCSARVLPPATPTAHTSFDEMTERSSSCANAWPVLGERPMDHAVPLQCSTSGRPDWRLVLLPSPTAQTSLEEAPATPRRMLALAPMFTDRTIFHVAPFQCSVIDFSEP